MTIYRLRRTEAYAKKNPGMTWFEEHELSLVTPRQQKILRLRSGMEDGKQWSLKMVADLLGLKSQESIRVEQNKAMYVIKKQREKNGPPRDVPS